mmetsp:Transcript_817/g.1617  ORF Transcript_817/g.1617 Transcript_817/m.1617 type:complete len:240 (+) Transcript_817:54-773(+)
MERDIDSQLAELGEDCEVLVLVPSQQTGALIGKGGATAKQFAVDTECQLSIEKVTGGRTGADTYQRVKISGAALNIGFALVQVAQLIAGDDGSLSLIFEVPPAIFGRLVGKGKTRLQEVTDATGAQLNTSDHMVLTSGEPVSSVTISGDLEAMHEGLRLLSSRVMANLKNAAAEGSLSGKAKGKGKGFPFGAAPFSGLPAGGKGPMGKGFGAFKGAGVGPRSAMGAGFGGGPPLKKGRF